MPAPRRYDDLARLAEPLRSDDFDPRAFSLDHGVDPEELVRLALDVVHSSTVVTRPDPTVLDVAAVFIQGFQLGLLTSREDLEAERIAVGRWMLRCGQARNLLRESHGWMIGAEPKPAQPFLDAVYAEATRGTEEPPDQGGA